MKFFLTLILSISFSAEAAPVNCVETSRRVGADLEAVAKFFEGGRQELKTKSGRALDMVKEFLTKEYEGDIDGYSYETGVTAIPQADFIAGTATAKAAISAIMGNAETWYLNEETKEANDEKRSKIRAAATRMLRHGLVYGFDAGAQGWGGSPATHLLFLSPKCRFVHSLFLGIVHD